jgi:hypothetical protein
MDDTREQPYEEFEEADERDIPGDAIALRDPSVPVTVSDMAALGDQGVSIIKSRHLVMQTIRTASIQMTYPEDWLLFRDTAGRIICYLQDAGCDRIAPLWGIEIFNVSKPEKISGENGSFVYLITGDGRCNVTGGTVEQIEGMRSSTDRIFKDVEGAEKEWLVRKSARANLDGSIMRELAGFKNVPLGELIAAAPDRQWEARAAKGKGYGSSTERQAVREGSKADVPSCPKCGGEMWDNRGRKTNPRAPDFKCKNKNCGEGVWEDSKKSKSSAPPPDFDPPEEETPPVKASRQEPPPPKPTNGGSKVGGNEEERTRLKKLIRAQMRSRNMKATAQDEYLQEFIDATGVECEASEALDHLPAETLQEIHEDLKRPVAGDDE